VRWPAVARKATSLWDSVGFHVHEETRQAPFFGESAGPLSLAFPVMHQAYNQTTDAQCMKQQTCGD